jgi:hypothetical protein
VLRVARETETTQENIQDWPQLAEGDLRFQLLTEEDISTVIIFLNLLPVLLNCPFVFSRRMRWAGHVVRMGRRGMHIGYWWESQKERIGKTKT